MNKFFQRSISQAFNKSLRIVDDDSEFVVAVVVDVDDGRGGGGGGLRIVGFC